jgi:ubiquitin-activating enzyme E1 C
MLEEHPTLRMSKASVTHEGNNLYMQSPEVLEQMTRPNLSVPMFELLKEVPYTTVHATGMAENNGKKVSSLRKLRVSFKGIEEASKMDTTVSS